LIFDLGNRTAAWLCLIIESGFRAFFKTSFEFPILGGAGLAEDIEGADAD